MNFVCVIRAGGSGTRLWPVSTKAKPKQFLPIISDHSLLWQTWDRVAPWGSEHIFITTNSQWVDLVREQIADVRPEQILSEPIGRNTGPGIALETAYLLELCESDTVVVSIPSDDFVGNPGVFRKIMERAIENVRNNSGHIVIPVVTPAMPDTGFSYVRASGDLHRITEWIEKPDSETCKKLVAQPEYYAHTGMYVWRLGTVADIFSEIAPKVWSRAQKVAKLMRSGDLQTSIAQMSEIEKNSIESLIAKLYTEKYAIVADAMQWSDVGKWLVVKKLLDSENENVASHENAHFIDTRNVLVYGSDRRVVCVGVENIFIVEGVDGTLLICDADRAHEIGRIAERFDIL